MGSRLEKTSHDVSKRIENHTFSNEEGDEYGASSFGGFAQYMRRKKLKLQNLDVEKRAHSSKPAIFRGIVAQVNGYTQPSLNDLHDLIVAHGGGFMQYLDGKTMVTHIIASSLTPKKVIEFRRYRIVKPAWIVDSVKAGRLLPWGDYRVVDEGAGQKLLGFENGQLETQVNNRKHGYREQSDTSWYTSQLQAREATNAPDVSNKQDLASSQDTVAKGDVSFTFSDVDRLDKAVEEQSAMPAVHTPDHTPLSTETSDVPPKESDMVGPAILTLTPPVSSDHVQDRNQTADSEILPAEAQQRPSVSAEAREPRGTKRPATPESDTPNKVAKLTAEEHNAILLKDPHIWKSTVVNPDFLEQYYRESRLHHLSTWKADLKAKLQALAADQSASQKAVNKRVPGARRYILHVDFDSFFVAVSLKKTPQLSDKPAVVAHGAGSGSEIASCNYPARTFGVKNGMWMRTAQVLCPDLVVLPYDFPGYEEASRKFYDAILATGGIVQSVSIDEALVDISTDCIAASGTDGVRRSEGCTDREQARADQVAQGIRDVVLEATGCHVSVGIGSNILLAKVALRKAKPAGQFQIKPEAVLDFIGALQVQDLPGVAHSLGGKLEEIGIKYVKDIRECSREKLTTTLGPKTGEKLWDYARGIDRTEVGEQVVRKSVSTEVNWGVRFVTQEQVDEFIRSLCDELQKRLIRERVKGRQLTVKIMRRSADAALDPPKFLGHGKCDVYNKSVQLGVATNDPAIILKDVMTILRTFGLTPGEYRGIGLQITKLETIRGGGPADGSQCRLQFRSNTSLPVEQEDDPIEDDPQTPKKARLRDIGPQALPTPKHDSPVRKPLNIAGTQFALPTQVDPKVLAELPADIRERLFPNIRPAEQPAKQLPTGGPVRAPSPLVDLPTRSQLDADTLAALPEEVRAEVLALYGEQASKPKKVAGQTVLPQSPRKNRTLPASKLAATAKRTVRSLFSSKRSLRSNTDSTLTQSNFVARPNAPDTGQDTCSETENVDCDLDAAFLAALPDDMRQEVIAQHRQARLRRQGGIDVSLHQPRNRGKKGITKPEAGFERLFRLPAQAPKPVFTNRKLSDIDDLRHMIGDWVSEFRDEAPFADDVGALVKYLAAVVAEERDIAKAVRVVKWLCWSVERESERNWQGDDMMRHWDRVLVEIKNGVQGAVRGRGLGEVSF